ELVRRWQDISNRGADAARRWHVPMVPGQKGATARRLWKGHRLVRTRHGHRGSKAGGAVVATKRSVPGPSPTLESHRQLRNFGRGDRLVKRDVSTIGPGRGEQTEPGNSFPAHPS